MKGKRRVRFPMQFTRGYSTPIAMILFLLFSSCVTYYNLTIEEKERTLIIVENDNRARYALNKYINFSERIKKLEKIIFKLKVKATFLNIFFSPVLADDNIIPNGDFEKGKKFPYGWGIMVKRFPGVKILPSDPRYNGRVKEGKNILWIKRKKGGKCILFLLNENAQKYASISEVEGMTFSSEMIKIEPKKKYIMEVEAKSTGPEGIIFLKGYRKLASGKFQERYRAPLQFHIKTDGKWKKFKREFRIPFPDIKWGIINLYAYGKRGKIWFDNVKLIKY